MNINLAQANDVSLTIWQMWALKHLAGAKALVDFGALCGTLRLRSGQAKSRALLQSQPMPPLFGEGRSLLDIDLPKML
jgi:hypothetical protein